MIQPAHTVLRDFDIVNVFQKLRVFRSTRMGIINISLFFSTGIVTTWMRCPDSATKEHLHQLSKNERIKNIPFLYYSDHDTHGVDIFKPLKYGSTKAASANRSPRQYIRIPCIYEHDDTPTDGQVCPTPIPFQDHRGHPRRKEHINSHVKNRIWMCNGCGETGRDKHDTTSSRLHSGYYLPPFKLFIFF